MSCFVTQAGLGLIMATQSGPRLASSSCYCLTGTGTTSMSPHAFKFFKIILNYVYVCIYMWVYRHVKVLTEARSVGSQGAGVTGLCELLDTGAGNQT